MRHISNTCGARSIALTCITLFALAGSARAAVVGVRLDTYQLSNSTANQVIDIQVNTTSTGQTVHGCSFYITVNDGGPNYHGSVVGPLITALNMNPSNFVQGKGSPGLLTGVNDAPTADSSQSSTEAQAWHDIGNLSGTQTVTMPSNGTYVTLAQIVVDTSGFSNTTFTLKLEEGTTLTKFATGGTASMPTTLQSWTVAVGTPEPASLALVGLAAPALLCRRRRIAV